MAALFVSGCAAKTTASARGGQAIPVQTAPVQVGDVSSVNSLTGTVVANIQTNLGAKIAGHVQSVSADIGDRVSTGQVLAQLDPVDLGNQLAQSQAQIQYDQAQVQNNQAAGDQAAADEQRQEAIYGGGAISQADLEQVRLKMNTTQAQLKAAQATLQKDRAAVSAIQQQLQELAITSPIGGIVSSRNIEAGEQVSSQTTLFTIAQTSSLFVLVNVSDQNIANVKPGTTAQITIPELGTTAFQGKVTNVSPGLDATSHAYPVKIQIANPDPRTLPGMTASIRFTGLTTQPGIIIPVQAVVETPQGSEVFTVENNVAHLHMVQMGAVSSDQAVITGGLQAGAQLVINGQDLLADGTRVTVVQDANQSGVQGMLNSVKRGAAGAGRGAAR